MAPSGATRAERVRGLILDTTSDLIAEVGVERATVDEVARRSGVAKTTIYRHFPTKSALVAASVNLCMELPTVPDTGSLRGDLLACFEGAVRHALDGRLGAMMLSVMEAAQRDPELDTLLADYTERRRRSLRAVLHRAVAHGELEPGVDIEQTVTLISGPIMYTKIVLRQPVTRALVEATVDSVLASLPRTATVV
jgi:AcrR family transcriptional regulator